MILINNFPFTSFLLLFLIKFMQHNIKSQQYFNQYKAINIILTLINHSVYTEVKF